MPAWFDARTVDPSLGGAQWPLGLHRVVAIKSDQVDVKDSTDGSKMLVFTLKVIEGPLTGFEGPYRLNLWHKGSSQSADIAAKQLSALCHVTQRFVLENGPQQGGIGSELFNIPFRIQVVPQKDEKYTQISSVTNDAGELPSKAGAAQQPAGQQQYAPGASPGPGGYVQPGQPQQPQQPQWQQPANQPPPHYQQQPAAQPQPQGQPTWQQPGVGGAPQGQPVYQQPPNPAQQPQQPQWQQQPVQPGAAQPSWNR